MRYCELFGDVGCDIGGCDVGCGIEGLIDGVVCGIDCGGGRIGRGRLLSIFNVMDRMTSAPKRRKRFSAATKRWSAHTGSKGSKSGPRYRAVSVHL